MDLSCKKCNQKYHIPDDRLSGKRFYFICEKCGHKIIIDQRGESWLKYQGLLSDELSAKDILDGIYFSFNLKNIIFSFFVIMGLAFFISIIVLIITGNMPFISEHPLFSGWLLFLAALIIIYIYDIHIYILSKNTFHRFTHDFNLKFSALSPDIPNDLKPIFLLSAGFALIFAILFFPVYLMKSSYSIVYEGIFHPVNIFLLGIIIFTLIFKNLIYAYIAFRSRDFKETFKNIFLFIRIENINLPIYSFLISSLSAIIYAFMLGIIIISLYIIFALIVPVLAADSSFSLQSFFNLSGMPAESGLFYNIKNFILTMSDGFTLIAISTSIILLFFFAFFINLKQTLSCISVYIMEKNPGRSLARNASMVIVSILSISALILFLSYR